MSTEREASATLTFVFTDLVDSTALLQRLGEERARVVFERHRERLAKTVGQHSGQELEWLGDGMLAAFGSSAQAVRCALTMQRTTRQRVHGESLRMRIGVQTGEAMRRPGGYFGNAIVVARRLCELAQPGQVLTSALVAAMLAGHRSIGLRELGKVSLKGFAQPVVPFEVLTAPARRNRRDGAASPASHAQSVQVKESLPAMMRELAATLRGVGRSDLSERARAAAARIVRPNTVVCVVGEFKQGKSSLINALLGADICPVDDDLATSALTLVHYSAEPSAHVRRREGSDVVVDEVPLHAISEHVSEAGNPRNQRLVERVDIGLPHPLLEGGLTLVDTPGMGGLGAGHAAATLAFLPYADGLIFATSALAGLSGPELAFLQRARELCPVVICGLTKVDIAPQWRRMAELDREHLARSGVDVPVLPLAAPLRRLAIEHADPGLGHESGFDMLVEVLHDEVIGPAKSRAVERARAEADALGQLTSVMEAEARIAEDPAANSATPVELEQAVDRLEHLRGPAARWSVLVGDRMADLAGAASHKFRAQIRTLARETDREIEDLNSPAQWDELGRQLATKVAETVAAVFHDLENGASELAGEVVELLRDESISVPSARLSAPLDVTALWRPASLDQPAGIGGVAGQAMAGLRGGYGGIFMFSILSRFLPAGAATLLLSNPVSLGIGVAFAGQALLETNRRKVAMRRQKARVAVQQFLDDVQFEVGNQLAETARTIQRDLRDEFSQRVAELQRTLAEAATRAQEVATRSAAERAARAENMRSAIAKLDGLRARIAAADEAEAP